VTAQSGVKLSLRGVQKSFGQNHVCRGIDLDVADGEMVCLIGASGSGKSTLLRCINLLEPIDDGAIFLDGLDIAEPGFDPQPVRERIGIVFQSYNLFPHMTAAENVMLAPMRVRGRSKVSFLTRLRLCLSALACPTTGTIILTSSQVGSSSAWRLFARWRWSRRSCCSMRSPPRLIRNLSVRFWMCCVNSTAMA
jgi:ABC-type sugar transport system ATPase subunit